LETVGSPLKKQRASLSADDEDMRKRFGPGLQGPKADVLGAIEHDRMNGGNVGPGPASGDQGFGFGAKIEVGELPETPAPVPAQAAGRGEEKPVKIEEVEEEL